MKGDLGRTGEIIVVKWVVLLRFPVFSYVIYWVGGWMKDGSERIIGYVILLTLSEPFPAAVLFTAKFYYLNCVFYL